MLEVTILKVSHGTLSEAKKVRPYIEASDVFSIENAAIMKDIAEAEDKILATEILPNWSRSKLRRELERINSATRPDQKEYMLEIEECIFRNKKIKWCLERHSPEQSYLVQELHEQADQVYAQSMMALAHSSTEQFISLYKQFLYYHVSELDLRDREMARSIIAAEEGIRKLSPTLQNKNPIVFSMAVGSLHMPERYMPFPAEVVPLTNKTNNPTYKLIKAILEDGVPFEDVKNLVLESGYYELEVHKR